MAFTERRTFAGAPGERIVVGQAEDHGLEVAVFVRLVIETPTCTLVGHRIARLLRPVALANPNTRGMTIDPGQGPRTRLTGER